MKGVYCLLIGLSSDALISFGKRTRLLENGYYIYVGSALNGLFKRISRHLRDDKKNHWHIDKLLMTRTAFVEKIYFFETKDDIECDVAKRLQLYSSTIDGFGCSDCKCKSHLFYLGIKADKRIETLLRKTLSFNIIVPDDVKKLVKKR